LTLWKDANYRVEQRLAEHKAGKGEKVYVAGGKELKEIAEAAGLGFVKEKALLQLRYLSGMPTTTIKKFLSTLDKVYEVEKPKTTASGNAGVGGMEKVSAGSAGSRTKIAAGLVTYSPKSKYLNAVPPTWPRMMLLENSIDTKTCGRAASQYTTELRKYKVAPKVIGARSMAVVVNAGNKLGGLSKLQLVRLINGQTKSWNDIKPLFTSGQAKVMIFAVDPALSEFKARKIAGGVVDAPTGGRGAVALSAFTHEVLLGRAIRSRYVEYLDSPKAVLSKVASVPNAIGLVPTSELTLNAIPTWNEKARADRKAALVAVKVLAIDGAKPTKPNCLAERPTYVLAKPVLMYTLPNLDKLDKVAAEFAKFVQGPLAAGSFHAEGMITPHSEIHFPSMAGNVKPGGSGMPKWGTKKPKKKPAPKKRPGTKPKPGTKPGTSPKPGATTKPAGKAGTTDTEGDKPKKKPLKGW
jgi:ABC-type phosphate transport system substrate-binding protein